MMRSKRPSVLMLAFQYPPAQASSGILRTASFSRYLSEHGWDVEILSAKITSVPGHEENSKLIPKNVTVHRTFALDAAKQLSIAGRYPSILELPDRYSSWILPASAFGYRRIRKQKFDVLFSTYPIASAHLTAWLLNRLTDIPWVADFRDPMLLTEHPATKARRWAHGLVEKASVTNCQRIVVTNEQARTLYENKYPAFTEGKIEVVENGFDEGLFERAEANQKKYTNSEGKITLLHSGTLYPNHRNPLPLFVAIAKLRSIGGNLSKVRIILRATGYDDFYRREIAKLGIQDCVFLEDIIPYEKATEELLSVDGLILLQGPSCDGQVPAKLYEYIRAKKPIFSILGVNGASHRVMEGAGISSYTFYSSLEDLPGRFGAFISAVSQSKADNYIPTVDTSIYSRTSRARELEGVLERAIAGS